MKDIFIELLEKTQDMFQSRETVLSLCDRNTTDYDRGIIQGKIEMLSYLMRELVGDEDEASTIRD